MLECHINRVFISFDVQKIVKNCFVCNHTGEKEKSYEDVLGFCKSAALEEVASHDYILTPGRYVGAEAIEDDNEVFTEKMGSLSKELAVQFGESIRLEKEIKESLASIGFQIEV